MKGVLFQETWRARPFWMLVGCILVNRATWRRAARVLDELADEFESPVGVLGAQRSTIARIVRPLGLQDARAKRIKDLAGAWLEMPLRPERMTRADVLKLPGCGRYAADSWDIFVRRVAVTPTDKKLLEYVRRGRLGLRKEPFP